MEIILNETIDALGQEGDIVTVKAGYARNFLIPQKKALPVNKATLARLKGEQQAIADRLFQQKGSAEKLSEQLAGKVVRISRKAGEENRLFGSVTNIDIAEELEKMGFSVDRKTILLAEPIKNVGEMQVAVKVGYQMTTDITVQVVPEEMAETASGD